MLSFLKKDLLEERRVALSFLFAERFVHKFAESFDQIVFMLLNEKELRKIFLKKKELESVPNSRFF
jgi:hypothetical protein